MYLRCNLASILHFILKFDIVFKFKHIHSIASTSAHYIFYKSKNYINYNFSIFIGFGIRKFENLVRASIVIILMMNLVN